MNDLRKKIEEKRRLENRGLHTAIIPGTGKTKTLFQKGMVFLLI